MDHLYNFIIIYPASLPIFFLIVCATVLTGLVIHDRSKSE